MNGTGATDNGQSIYLRLVDGVSSDENGCFMEWFDGIKRLSDTLN